MDEHTPARDARELAEVLADRLNATVGQVTIELVFRDGRLINGYRHGKFGARELEQIDVSRRRDEPVRRGA